MKRRSEKKLALVNAALGLLNPHLKLLYIQRIRLNIQQKVR